MKCDKCGTNFGPFSGDAMEAEFLHTSDACISALSAQLAAERAKSARLERKWAQVEECLTKDSWSRITAKAALYDAALAAQKAAEERAERYRPAYEREQHTREILKECGYDVDSMLGPQAPAAEPEGSGK